ncbi:MAG: primosomal protein N' [Planctomycetota bacterium]|nr:primosomal protein N' [Planctomycetota bacterium]
MHEELFATGDDPRHAAPAGYARVALEHAFDTDDATLTYAFDADAPSVGERVEVPLGRGVRRVAGIVVDVGGPELLGTLSPTRVRLIARRTHARLPPDLVALARWIAEYYACPLGIVLAGMMPAAVKVERRARTVTLVDLAPDIDPVEPDAPDGAPPDAPARAAPARPALRATARVALERLLGAPRDLWPMPLARAIALAEVKSRAPLDSLARAGRLRLWDDVRTADDLTDPDSLAPARPRAPVPELTPEQHAAVEGIAASPGFGVHLLRGVTGSGKTEVYLRLIERTLRAGRAAIVLVPEISLTPQTVSRFTDRFGPALVTALHSGLTPAQRRRAWLRAAAGAARVVVGARSAMFAPVVNLGMIVVDEEHDASYKQDRAPRYHARDAAVQRAHQAGVPIVLGSATPALESWHNARTGKYRLWTLPARVGGGTLPQVDIVDMTQERRARRAAGLDDGRVHLLGPTLEAALERTLRAGGQAILLLNRRGLARYVWCRNTACGHVLACDHCDASLVVHRTGDAPGGGIVRCHHCDAAQRVPPVCPLCASKMSLFGWGTQRAEDELAGKFASLGLEVGATLLRLDSDEVRSAADYARALGAFERGEARVLLGTQMIAKGLDFPNVRLVGVIDADTSISTPDFRAAERTFQLVSQVAGRAGRGVAPGLVIVQTLRPDEPAIVLASRHDFESFAALELAARERTDLPPFARLARVICRDENPARAREAAQALADRFLAEGTLRVRGPMPCVIARIAGEHRIAVELLAPRAGPIQRALAGARAAGLLHADSRTQVDVDPAALL